MYENNQSTYKPKHRNRNTYHATEDPAIMRLEIRRMNGDTYSSYFDAADLDTVKRRIWRVNSPGHRKGPILYVGTGTTPNVMSLPCYLLSPPPGHKAVHINGNGLDCRRANLEVKSEQQIAHEAASHGPHIKVKRREKGYVDVDPQVGGDAVYLLKHGAAVPVKPKRSDPDYFPKLAAWRIEVLTAAEAVTQRLLAERKQRLADRTYQGLPRGGK